MTICGLKNVGALWPHTLHTPKSATSQCEYINTTRKDSGLPYFSFLKNLELCEQTKTDNILKVPSYLLALHMVSFIKAHT